MTPTAPGLGEVVVPVETGEYYAAVLAPGAAGSWTLDTAGVIDVVRATDVVLADLNPSLPTIAEELDAKGSYSIIGDGLNLATGDGTVLALYNRTAPDGTVLVSWDVLGGAVRFRAKDETLDEAIGPAIVHGSWMYWCEFTWSVSPSDVNISVMRAKADFSSLTTLATWEVNSVDLDAGAISYAFDPGDVKMLIADTIQVAARFDEDGGGGPARVHYWWRFSLAGANESRQAIIGGDWEEIPWQGHDLVSQVDPAGAAGWISFNTHQSNRSLVRIDDDDPTAETNHWPITGTWADEPWSHSSVRASPSDALLYSYTQDRLIRDSIAGPFGSAPTVDLALSQPFTFDVVAFRV